LIGFGSLVGPLSHSVLYLLRVLPQHSPSSDFGENQLSRGLISLSLLLSSHLRIFQHSRVRSFIQCYLGFNLLKSRSPPLRVYCQRLVAHLALAFTSPPVQRTLGWPLTITRRLIMQKASSHPAHSKIHALPRASRMPLCRRIPKSRARFQNGLGSYTLYAIGFRSISLP
jgi:hypothetical protein